MSGHSERRARTVTDEPFRIDPELLGRPLASVRRRTLAVAVDGTLIVILGLPVILALSLGALWLQAPGAYEAVIAAVSGEHDEDASIEFEHELLRLTASRRPGALPAELLTALETEDPREVERVMNEGAYDLLFDLGDTDPSSYDADDRRIEIRGDVLFGRAQSAASLFGIALLYFTLAGVRGRTPGKWLAGIRVERLDGSPMTLWTAFQRAGGYSASLSTLGLGFLQAVRDPNRQALHDRICSTVVVRAPRWRRRTEG